MLPVPHKGSNERGFSLLEALLAVTITIIVMVLVAQTMAHMSAVYDRESEAAAVSSAVGLAFEDMTEELARAGTGLGEGVPAVVPLGNESIVVRSNPDFVAGHLVSTLAGPEDDVFVRGRGAELLEVGAQVLVIDARRAIRAEVVRAGAGGLGIRSLESEDGEFVPPFSSEDEARVLAVREVTYALDGPHLIKNVLGVGERVLTRDARGLSFEYLDPEGETLAIARAATNPELAAVGLKLDYNDHNRAASLRSVVALGPRSGTVDFEDDTLGFRLSRIFYPLESPSGVASRVGEDWGVILASGARSSDPSYLYIYPMEEDFMSAAVDNVRWLEDVRGPVALAFGPENGPLAGSLFVAAAGLRIGHLARITFGDAPTETSFDGTEAIAQASGLVFGVDGALYIAGQEKGAIFRFRFDPSGNPLNPERLFSLSGTPRAITEGTDGHLYLLVNRQEQGIVWKMAFDETLTPVEPVALGSLGGVGISLTRDPIAGTLFALVRERGGDHVVLELDRRWLDFDPDSKEKRSAPRVVFSLRDWQERLQEGSFGPRELPFPPQELPQRMAYLTTDVLDFIAFDARGSLYMGVRGGNLVLKFELDRPSGRYAVGLAAGVIDVEGKTIRLHAWKKGPP